MQDTVRVNGIVLSAMPVGEADRRILLYTKELGRISCFVRGARKPTSPFVGKTRPFSFGRFDLYPGRDAMNLQAAEITEYFEPLASDPLLSAYGSCILELTSRVGQENADGTLLLTLVYYALLALMKGRMTPELTWTVFQAKVLEYEGLMPAFTTCLKCGKPLKTGVFKPSYLGPLCGTCAPEGSGYPLSESTLYAFTFVRNEAPNRLFSFALSEAVFSEFRQVVRFLRGRMLSRPLSSEELLEVFQKQ